MTAKEIEKYKTKSLSSLHAEAKKYFNLYIRLRDTDENGFGNCISTGQSLRLGSEQAQAGHYFAAGKYKSLEFHEDNVHLQSKQDNYFGHDFASYGANLVKKIGQERFEKLIFLAQYEKKHGYKQDRFTLIEIIDNYKEKCKIFSFEKAISV